jgi:hypothetical protein
MPDNIQKGNQLVGRPAYRGLPARVAKKAGVSAQYIRMVKSGLIINRRLAAMIEAEARIMDKEREREDARWQREIARAARENAG